MSTKKYKQYFRVSNIPLPKTTCWRSKKLEKEITLESSDVASQCTSKITRKRKAYVSDPKIPIPRQTLWFWKKSM